MQRWEARIGRSHLRAVFFAWRLWCRKRISGLQIAVAVHRAQSSRSMVLRRCCLGWRCLCIVERHVALAAAEELQRFQELCQKQATELESLRQQVRGQSDTLQGREDSSCTPRTPASKPPSFGAEEQATEDRAAVAPVSVHPSSSSSATSAATAAAAATATTESSSPASPRSLAAAAVARARKAVGLPKESSNTPLNIAARCRSCGNTGVDAGQSMYMQLQEGAGSIRPRPL